MHALPRPGGLRPRRITAMAVVAAAHAVAGWALLQAPAARDAFFPAPALEVQVLERTQSPPPEVAARPFPVRLAAIEPPRIDVPPIDIAVPPEPAPQPPPAPAPAPAPAAITPVSAPPPPAAVLHAPRVDLRYLDNPAPAYPPASRRAGERGKVVLRVHVLADGSVASVEVHASSGFRRLDQAALDAVRCWRFLPARRGALAVAGHALVPIDFTLARRG